MEELAEEAIYFNHRLVGNPLSMLIFIRILWRSSNWHNELAVEGALSERPEKISSFL